jgi:hypothetical protein
MMPALPERRRAITVCDAIDARIYFATSLFTPLTRADGHSYYRLRHYYRRQTYARYVSLQVSSPGCHYYVHYDTILFFAAADAVFFFFSAIRFSYAVIISPFPRHYCHFIMRHYIFLH